MKFQRNDDFTHVYVEGKEGEFEVLRAIVQASFDSAVAVGMGRLHYNSSTKMSRNEAEKFIDKKTWDQPNRTVVEMDYVGGRQCKTTIWRAEKNHFTIATHSFERDRGSIREMLEIAKAIIEKERSPGDEVDSSKMYVGENLDKRLAEYDCKRKTDESDWAFRKRIFPELHLRISDGRAVEFLYGKVLVQWSQMEVMLSLSIAGVKDRAGLKKFADGFADDPLKMWPIKVMA